MAIQMNIGDHISPEAGFIAVPNKHRAAVNWARARAKIIVRDMPAADRYFATLPGGRSLASLLGDSTIWINFNPGMAGFGEQSVAHNNEIAIGPAAFRVGRWTVLATLVHELAHVDGAPGGADRRAEEALLRCGLGKWSEHTTGRDDPGTPYDPTISG